MLLIWATLYYTTCLSALYALTMLLNFVWFMGCLQAVAQLLKEPESLNGSSVVAAEQAIKGIIQV